MSFIKHTGYTYIEEYSDSVENLISNKTMKVDSSNVVIKGEENSQYIPFLINRFYDGVDLTDKVIKIHYLNANNEGDYSVAINVEYDDSQIRFGWLVPATACLVQGDLRIAIEVFGSNSIGENYDWKSNIYYMTVERSLDTGEGLVQPGENWYNEFTQQVDLLRKRIQAVTAEDVVNGAEIRDARIDDQGTEHPTVNERFISDLKRMYAKKNYELLDQNKGEPFTVFIGTQDAIAESGQESQCTMYIPTDDEEDIGGISLDEILEKDIDDNYKPVIKKAKYDADGNEITKTYLKTGESTAIYPFQEKNFQAPAKASLNNMGLVFDLSNNCTYLIIALTSCALADYYSDNVIGYLKSGVNFLSVIKNGGDDGQATYILNNASASVNVNDILCLCAMDINGIQTYKFRYK